MKRLRIGEPVTARDVEEMAGYDQPQSFVRLCNALVMTDLDRLELHSDCDLTERPGRDGGIDAQAIIVVDRPNVDGGLVGSGRNILQFKWRTVTSAGRRRAIDNLIRSLAVEVATLREPATSACYTLLTNLDLSISERRRLKASLESAWPSTPPPLLGVWGAAEIAAFLNEHPRLRHSFFIEGSLTTWEVAAEGLRALYGDAWPPFVGRKAELERIRAFVKDGPGCLIVTGPPYVGKTRLVLEALAPHKARVVWSSDPGSFTEGQILDLDQEVGTILVIDQCSGERVSEITRWARSRKELTTILSTLQDRRIPGTSSLRLDSLSADDSESLLRDLAPRLPILRFLWLKRVAGGLPGLALFAARYVGSLAAEETTDQSPDDLLGALAERFLSSLDQTERAALEVFSLLPRLALNVEEGSACSKVCQALRLQMHDVESVAGGLRRKGHLIERDGLLEVVPTLLAEVVAGSVYRRRPTLLATLFLRLPSQRDGLFERLSRVRGPDGGVAEQVAGVFGTGGLFPDIEALKVHLDWFRKLVSAAPEAAVKDLARLIRSAPENDLIERFSGERAWTLASALKWLAERSETFNDAVEILLKMVLAAGGNDTSQAFSQSFMSCFHYLHPRSSVPVSQRLEWLRALSRHKLATHRELAAKATGQALTAPVFFYTEEPEGPEIPPAPTFPRLRDEALDAAKELLGLLQSLVGDETESVSEVARMEVVTRFDDLISFSWDGVRFGDLVNPTLQLAKAAFEKSGNQQAERSRILSQIDATSMKFEKGQTRLFGPRADREALREIARSLRELRDSLLRGDWSRRLRYHAGPVVYTHAGTYLASGSHPGTAHEREAEDLAREVTEGGRPLQEELDWLLSKEAEHDSDFFIALGRHDRERKWIEPILQRAGSHMGPDAFGRYVMGWAALGGESPAAVDQKLDDLARIGAECASPVISASLRRPYTLRALERFLLAARGRPQDMPTYLYWLSLSPWLDALSSEAVEKIALSLYGDDLAVSRALVYLLSRMVEHRPGGPLEMSPKTQEIAWRSLERSLPQVAGVEEFAWSVLASELGRIDPPRLGELLPRALLDSTVNHRRWGSRMLEEPISVLEKHDRPVLVRAILSAVEVEDLHDAFHWPPFARVLNLSKDSRPILDWMEKHESGARARAISLLEPTDAAFHDFAVAALAATEGDPAVREALLAQLCNVGFHTGSPLPELERRLAQVMEGLGRKTEPSATEWLLEARANLESWINERPGYFWDSPMTRADMEELLSAPESPERKWAVRRILERAPRDEALRLLTREDIEAASEDSAMEEKARLAWRTYLEFRHPVR